MFKYIVILVYNIIVAPKYPFPLFQMHINTSTSHPGATRAGQNHEGIRKKKIIGKAKNLIEQKQNGLGKFKG